VNFNDLNKLAFVKSHDYTRLILIIFALESRKWNNWKWNPQQNSSFVTEWPWTLWKM